MTFRSDQTGDGDPEPDMEPMDPVCDDDTDAFRIGIDEEDDEQDEMPHDPLPDLFRPLPVGLTKRRVPSRYS